MPPQNSISVAKEKSKIISPSATATSYHSPQFQQIQSLNKYSTMPLNKYSSPSFDKTATLLLNSTSTPAEENGKSVPKPTPKQISKANNEGTVSAGRKSFDLLHEKSVTVEPNGLLADLKAGGVPVNVIRENYFAPKNDFRGPPRVQYHNGFQKEPLVSPHVPLDIEDNKTREENSDCDSVSEQNPNSQISLPTGNQGYNASERFDSKASSMDRDQQSSPQTAQSNVDNAFGRNVPIVPWYYQHIERGDPWKSRNSENSEFKRTPTNGKSPGSDLTRHNIRNFFLNGNEYLEQEERRTPTKTLNTDFPKTTALFVEEPGSLPREEQVFSRDSSVSSVSTSIPNVQRDRNYSMNSNEYSENYGDSYTRSRSSSLVLNSEIPSAAIGVRERINEYQQRSNMASPAHFTTGQKPPRQQFPPLNLIPQLRQQTSEPTGVWVERLGSQLKQYMDPSSAEFNVIIRWMLSCGGRRDANFPTRDSSIYLSIDDILNRMDTQEDSNEANYSRSLPPVKTVEKEEKMNLNVTAFDSKTYRPSIRKWRYGVRDSGAATVDKTTVKSVRWAYPNIATVVEFNQRFSSLSCESVFIR
ncbi:unnamed protein product [Hymenolepis diminuta]|nr:unnamed protein product [Hymenolepis diminuta]